MALIKTMMVVQREGGRKVKINAADFDARVYMTEAEIAAEAAAPKIVPKAEKPKPAKAKPEPEPEPAPAPRRRRR